MLLATIFIWIVQSFFMRTFCKIQQEQPVPEWYNYIQYDVPSSGGTNHIISDKNRNDENSPYIYNDNAFGNLLNCELTKNGIGLKWTSNCAKYFKPVINNEKMDLLRRLLLYRTPNNNLRRVGDDNFVRYERSNSTDFMRFGRSKSRGDDFMRLGRSHINDFMHSYFSPHILRCILHQGKHPNNYHADLNEDTVNDSQSSNNV